MNETRYKLIADNDGHRYIIEAGDEDLFYAWVDAMENDEEHEGKSFEDRRMNVNRLTFLDPQGWN